MTIGCPYSPEPRIGRHSVGVRGGTFPARLGMPSFFVIGFTCVTFCARIS